MMAGDTHPNGAPSLESRLATAQAEGLEANVRRMLMFVAVGGPVELQALGVRQGRYECNRASHARLPKDAITLCREADSWESDGVFVLPSQLRAGVETRHRTPGGWYDQPKGGSTTDSDVRVRCAFGVDSDVVRPSKISATDEEMARSVATAIRVWDYLASIVSTESLAYVHSGNGRQIWVALDAVSANEDTRLLLASILAGLDAIFSTTEVKIDQKLSDHKRILPACGTVKKKGAAGIAERPHRRTAIVTPERPRRLQVEDLWDLHARIRQDCDECGRAKMDKAKGIKLPKPGPANHNSGESPFDRANALDPQSVAEFCDLYDMGELRCPGCGESQGVDVIDHGLKCLHNRCAGKGKSGFRTNVDLVAEVRGVEPREAVQLLAERFGFEPLREPAPDAPYPPGQFRDEQKERVARAAFRIWTPEEIWKPLEPPDYLMAGLLVRGTLALVVAYGSSLKTWVLEDAALSVATGQPWMGRFDTKQAEALIVDFESGDYELRRRAHRIARGRGLAIPIAGFGFVTMPDLSLACDEFFTAIKPLAGKYGFIGIDSLAAGSGGIDENDARFATSLNRLKAIAASTGCVIVVLHHSRKGNGEDTDPREMVRGSSAIFNACDVVLQMTRGKDGAFVMKQTKARAGKAVEPFVVRVDDIDAESSAVVASNVQDSDGGLVGSATKALAKVRREILLLLAQERGLPSKVQIYNRIGGSKPIQVKGLAELVEENLVVEHNGAWRLASEVSQ